MPKPLSKHEQWLFKWTLSEATTIPSQRKAIERCGLKGLNKKQVLALRERKFREWCATKDDLPEWYLAAWYEEGRAAREMFGRAPVDRGRAVSCKALQYLAYDQHHWGRSRRRDYGAATPQPAYLYESDNGKPGWNRVIERRCVDYTCVLSPDGKQVVVQTKINGPMTVHSIFHGRLSHRSHFMYHGKRVLLDGDDRYVSWGGIPAYQRAYARLYRMHGLDARLVRQSDGDIQIGSGEDTSGYIKVIVIADGQGGFYHTSGHESVQSIRAALANRRRKLRATELDQIILSQGDTLFVGIEDSLAAGNCSPGTQAFIVEFSKGQGAVGPIGAATAKAILSYRDDIWTRRACQAAAMRYLR